jgi:hypothetical protein
MMIAGSAAGAVADCLPGVGRHHQIGDLRLQRFLKPDHHVDEDTLNARRAGVVGQAATRQCLFDSAGAFSVEALPFQGIAEGILDRLLLGIELVENFYVFASAKSWLQYCRRAISVAAGSFLISPTWRPSSLGLTMSPKKSTLKSPAVRSRSAVVKERSSASLAHIQIVLQLPRGTERFLFPHLTQRDSLDFADHG